MQVKPRSIDRSNDSARTLCSVEKIKPAKSPMKAEAP